MRTLSAAVLLFLAGLGSLKPNSDRSQEASKMSQKSQVAFIKSDSLPPTVGYSQAVVATHPGKIIYIAGQVSMDRAGKVVGEGDIAKQAQQTFENLDATLKAAGATFENVVKLNYYVMDASNLVPVRDARDKFVNRANPPASTLVEVKRLFRPEFLIEVEAVAVLPD